MPAAKRDETLDDQPTYVSFTGMKTAAEFAEFPKMGDRQTFIVIAECRKPRHFQLMEDGQVRPLMTMKVVDIQAGEITKAPADPQLQLVEDED